MDSKSQPEFLLRQEKRHYISGFLELTSIFTHWGTSWRQRFVRLFTKCQKTVLEKTTSSQSLLKKGLWALLKGVPLSRIEAPKRVIEIVKDFEKTNQKYIV